MFRQRVGWSLLMVQCIGCVNDQNLTVVNGSIHTDWQIDSTELDIELDRPDVGIEAPQENYDTLQNKQIWCGQPLDFILPKMDTYYQQDHTLSAVVHTPTLPANQGFGIIWEVDGRILSETPIDSAFTHFTSEHNTEKLGRQTIQARLNTPDGTCETPIPQSISVCEAHFVEDFEDDADNWIAVGDAVWDESGWVELTENEQGRQGALYNPNLWIEGGSVSIRMTIQTGDGVHGGADGLALSFVPIENPHQLDTLLAHTLPGGGIGYALPNEEQNQHPNIFTVELDTFENTGDYEHTDPTSADHIALTQGADAGNHLVWQESPTIADFALHDIRIDIEPQTVAIFLDGEQILHQKKQIDFQGGYMFLSGSTGWVTNRHIIHDLEIYHGCQ